MGNPTDGRFKVVLGSRGVRLLRLYRLGSRSGTHVWENSLIKTGDVAFRQDL